MPPDSITCPCGATSHHPVDVRTGWCDACHRFTGKNADQVKAVAAEIKAEGDQGVASTILYRLGRYGAISEYAVDDLWPRDEEHRYRIYGRVGDELTVLAAASDAGGVGQALVTLHADAKRAGRRLADHGQIGVLDVMPDGRPSAAGDWVVLPFGRGGP